MTYYQLTICLGQYKNESKYQNLKNNRNTIFKASQKKCQRHWLVSGDVNTYLLTCCVRTATLKLLSLIKYEFKGNHKNQEINIDGLNQQNVFLKIITIECYIICQVRLLSLTDIDQAYIKRITYRYIVSCGVEWRYIILDDIYIIIQIV